MAGRTGEPGVTISERVPDIRRSFDDADILMAPMTIAGGSKFKILEAMASGVPVVTTKDGAEGLQVKNNTHIMLSDSVSGFLAALERLADDASFRSGSSGRHVNWFRRYMTGKR